MKLWKKVPKKERSKEIVSSIIESTATLLEQDGHQKISTNKIAEKAGISIGSLYQYFSNKESVLETVMTTAADDYTKFFLEQVAKTDAKDADSFVRIMIECTFDYLMNRRGQFKAIYDLHQKMGKIDLVIKLRYRNAVIIGTHLHEKFPNGHTKEEYIKYIYTIQCQNFGIFHSFVYAEDPPYTFEEMKAISIDSTTLLNRMNTVKPVS